MIKKVGYLFTVTAIAIFAYTSLLVSGTILAKNDEVYVLPESAGVYDVPGKPDVKLKVIVYHGKDGAAVKGGKVPPLTPAKTCGLSSTLDPDSDSIVSPAEWKLPSSWTYRVNLSSVPNTIGGTKANSLINNAYNTWQAVLGSSTTFVQGANTNTSAAKFDGQNIVTWGRASSTTLAITYIWYNTVGGYATEIDTIMNNRFTWYWSDPSLWGEGQICAYQGVYDAQGILTHELGHTVGLDDEYDAALYANNTMYGYGLTGDAKESTLATGDILGAKAIYGLQ